jgi:hypothetical protein
VPGEGDDTGVYVIPQFLWRDRFYDDLAPGHGDSASIGSSMPATCSGGLPASSSTL